MPKTKSQIFINISLLLILCLAATGLPTYAESFITSIASRHHLSVESTAKVLSYKTEIFDKYYYISSQKPLTQNDFVITLFFPCNDYLYLIPITSVYSGKNSIDDVFLSIATGLLDGPPKALGLPIDDSIIPPIHHYSLSDENAGTLNLFLDSSEMNIFNTHATSARIALNSLVNSFTALADISSVQFLFDGEVVEHAFHGVYMEEPILPYNGALYYVGYITNTDRILLLPKQLNDANATIDDIFNKLKKGDSHTHYHNQNIIFPVPNKVNLLDYELKDRTLTLLFDYTFVEACEDLGDLELFMIESLLFTFCSLDFIDYISIRIKGQDSNIISNYDYSKPTKAPEYVNFSTKKVAPFRAIEKFPARALRHWVLESVSTFEK